jgi:hypothetical protein
VEAITGRLIVPNGTVIPASNRQRTPTCVPADHRGGAPVQILSETKGLRHTRLTASSTTSPISKTGKLQVPDIR